MRYAAMAMVVALGWSAVSGAGGKAPAVPGTPLAISYTALQLDSIPGDYVIGSHGDTVTFALYFVDTDCRSYAYTAQLRKQSIVITRSPVQPDSSVTTPPCTAGSDALVGVEGFLTGVPSGTYWFELWTTCAGKGEQLMKDAVKVK